jgi:hypothetical protein
VSYLTGVKISDRQMPNLPITHDLRHGDWNCALHPNRDTPGPR